MKTVSLSEKKVRLAAPQFDRAKTESTPTESREQSEALQRRQASFERTIVNERQAMAKEVEEEKRRGYEEAFKKGFKEGRDEGIESLKERSEELTAAINEIFKEKNELMHKSREQILKLALDVSKQIIQTEISLQPSVSKNIVEEAIKRITDRDHVVIRLNPMEANWIRTHQEVLKDKMQDIGQLVIQEDEGMEAGGCIIETKLGYIDASLSTKLKNIEASFLKLFDDEEGYERPTQPVRSEVPPVQKLEPTEPMTAEAPIMTSVEESFPEQVLSNEPLESIVSEPNPEPELISEQSEESIEDFDKELMSEVFNTDETTASAATEPSSESEKAEPSFSFDDDFDDEDFDFDDLDLD